MRFPSWVPILPRSSKSRISGFQSEDRSAILRRGTNLLRRPSHGEGELNALHFVYVLERVRHDLAGWKGVITEVHRERNWIRVTWSRSGPTWLNQDIYTLQDFLSVFDWDAEHGTWLIKERRPA